VYEDDAGRPLSSDKLTKLLSVSSVALVQPGTGRWRELLKFRVTRWKWRAFKYNWSERRKNLLISQYAASASRLLLFLMMRRRSQAAAMTAAGIRSANAPVTALDIAAVNGNLMATSYWCTLRSVELFRHLVTAAAHRSSRPVMSRGERIAQRRTRRRRQPA
jgi:hypothetical protein